MPQELKILSQDGDTPCGHSQEHDCRAGSRGIESDTPHCQSLSIPGAARSGRDPATAGLVTASVVKRFKERFFRLSSLHERNKISFRNLCHIYIPRDETFRQALLKDLLHDY